MDLDPRLVVIAAVVALVVLWVTAFALGRVDARVTARGLRNGALIAAALFAITAVIVSIVFNGRPVFAEALDLGGAVSLGLLVGALVALGYLWLGGVLIAIGLIFKSKPQWTTLGAWAAVPVIIVSFGIGYVSYRSVAAEGAATSSANGSVAISLSQQGKSPISASGAATCATAADGSVTITTGTPADPHIITTDGRLTQAQVRVAPALGEATLDTFSIFGIDAVPESVTTAPGSTSTAGQLQLSVAPWTGALTWTCNQ